MHVWVSTVNSDITGLFFAYTRKIYVYVIYTHTMQFIQLLFTPCWQDQDVAFLTQGLLRQHGTFMTGCPS